MPAQALQYPKLTKALKLLTALIAVRMLAHHSLHFGFLLWNLFLSIVPLILSHNIPTIRNPINACLCATLWLALFPNSAYLITDIIHLHYHAHPSFLLDVAILT